MRYAPIAAMAMATAMLIPAAAQSQAPQVAPELLDRNLHRTETQIRFCIGETAYQRPLEEDLALAIADALLLDAEIHYYPPLNSPSAYDYVIGPTLDEMFLLLTNECDAFMGMNLVGDLADWLLFSRPLYTTRFALMSLQSSGLTALSDLGDDEAIGTRVSSTGDLQLGVYLRNQPDGAKPHRFPYNDNIALYDNLLEGEIDAALIWEPALIGLAETHPDAPALHEMDLGDFRPPEISFGIVYLTKSTYLRTMVDDAIGILLADGTIRSILDAHYPGALTP